MPESPPKIATVIITNNIEYLREAVESSIGDLFIIYDGIKPEKISGATEFQVEHKFPSMSRNFALSKLSDYEFVQFLDSDDYLLGDYFEQVLPIVRAHPDFSIFYTDYEVDLVELDFTHKEYLQSLYSKNANSIVPKIKNPLIRLSKLRFDEQLPCFEYIDYIFKSGVSSTFHIPHFLQHVRIHNKSYESNVPQKVRAEAYKAINNRTLEKE